MAFLAYKQNPYKGVAFLIHKFNFYNLFCSCDCPNAGKEVAVYCSVKLGDIIQSMVAYREGDIDKALKDAFMHFDELLLGPDVIKEMKQIAKNDLAEDR